MSSPRQRRKLRTRQAVMDAALAMVRENGPHGLSLRAVAKRVDYSPAALYEYFGSKDALIGALCNEGMQRFDAALRSVPVDEDNPQAYFVQIGLQYIAFAEANPEHFRLMFDRIGTNTELHLGPPKETEQDTFWMVMAEAVRLNIAAGHFKVKQPGEEKAITLGLWQLVHGMAILQITMFRATGEKMTDLHIYNLKTLYDGYVAGNHFASNPTE